MVQAACFHARVGIDSRCRVAASHSRCACSVVLHIAVLQRTHTYQRKPHAVPAKKTQLSGA